MTNVNDQQMLNENRSNKQLTVYKNYRSYENIDNPAFRIHMKVLAAML